MLPLSDPSWSEILYGIDLILPSDINTANVGSAVGDLSAAAAWYAFGDRCCLIDAVAAIED